MTAADSGQALNPDAPPERTHTPRSATGSAAVAVAAKLREEILSDAEPGTFLGSEDDLLARLGVSRPTLRQAARILEHEDLLTVRRGKKGGLFARRPTSDTVAHVASVVLRAHGATLEDLTRVNAFVGAEVARLAAERAPEHDRRSLHALAVEQLGADDESVDDPATASASRLGADPPGDFAGDPPGDFAGDPGGDSGDDAGGDVAGRAVLDTVLEVNRRLATLSGSPTLAMFGSVLAELAHANAEVRMFTDTEQLVSTRRYVRALTAAVANSDADEAAELVERHHDRLLRWMRRQRPSPPGGSGGGHIRVRG